MAKQKRKSAPIATHAVIGGKKFLLAKTWDETKNVMALIDDQVEVVDPKLRTGVVDISSELFRGFAWSRHQMPKALEALGAATEVTLEFLPAEPKAPAARKAKPKAEPKSPLEAPAEPA